MSYHLTGLISAVIFLLTLGGLWSQLRFVWKRKRTFQQSPSLAESPTAVLSLNQFLSSFLAFFSFVLYGSCLEPFNHYLVWPRLAAAVLTLAVLYEIMADRKAWLPTLSFISCAALLLAAPMLWLLTPEVRAWGRKVSQALIVTIAVILAQGYSHQIVLIRQSGQTGAVSLRLHQFFFLKDASTIAFALAMGLRGGWPVLLLSSVSAITKLATMWHFRWARLSPAAQRRRETLLQRGHKKPLGGNGLPAFPPPMV
jgi:hypothetical protein